jgi:glycosyltransferase involved in cell wall biosynthesis
VTTARPRVGVDATSWGNRRGFGRFARNAVGRLVELDGDTEYVLYLDADTASAGSVPAAATRRVVDLTTPASTGPTADSRRSVPDLVRLYRAAGRDRLDAFLFPSTYTYFPVPVRTVVGLHDNTGYEIPRETFPSRRSRMLWRGKERMAVRRAAQLFTVSRASQLALAARLGVSETALPIVPEAPDPVFAPRSADDVERAVASLGLPADARFFLYSGGISPSKNLETLVRGYAALVAMHPDAPSLVVVGDLDTEVYVSAAGPLREQIRDLRLERRVVLPGFIDDDTLAALYSGATAAVNPSLAEGFGLPAVEAARCGATVVLSDLPAHRDRLGDAALYFPARDANALTGQLARVLDETGLASDLAEKARAAVADLTWDAAAETLRTLVLPVAEAGRGAGR